MIEEILKKESIEEADMAILMKNMDQLSDSDLVRLGLKEAEPEIEVEKPKKIKK